MKKTILWFVGMKILEISAIVFVPWGVGLLTASLEWYPLKIYNSPGPWFDGFVNIFFLLCVFVLGCIIVQYNWRFAQRKAGVK